MLKILLDLVASLPEDKQHLFWDRACDKKGKLALKRAFMILSHLVEDEHYEPAQQTKSEKRQKL